MNLLKITIAISAICVCAFSAVGAYPQSLGPNGPSNGGFGFKCDTSGEPMECECYGDRDCAALGAADICDQIVVVVDGEQRSVDALICKTGPDGFPASPPDCHCSGPLESDTSWLTLYGVAAPFENAPLRTAPVPPDETADSRPNESVNTRRGTERAAPRRSTRDHRNDD